jgi:hypothetical protein
MRTELANGGTAVCQGDLSRSRSRYLDAVLKGNASRICRTVHSAVGCAVTLKCTCRQRSCWMTMNTNSIWQSAVGTVKKSVETSCFEWFFRKVRHVCDGGFGCAAKSGRSLSQAIPNTPHRVCHKSHRPLHAGRKQSFGMYSPHPVRTVTRRNWKPRFGCDRQRLRRVYIKDAVPALRRHRENKALLGSRAAHAQ